jgi:hypothetical protein
LADISDITAYLAQAAVNACYPNGTSQPSVAGADVLVFEGWPIPEVLDFDLTGRMLGANGQPVPRPRGIRHNVSVFPMAGTGVIIPQILDDTYVIVPPAYGLAAGVSQNPSGGAFTVTLTGTPGAGEFLTIEIDQYYVASATGASNGAILNTLAAQINTFPKLSNPLVPGYVAAVNGSNLTITGCAYCLPRLGATGTLGKVVHKQRQSVMVTVWAADHATRTTLAQAIDVFIKSSLTVPMPDTSTALIVYSRTNVIDETETVACYRRDLIYNAEYATVEQFPGTVITSVTTQIAPLDTVTQNFTGTQTAA